MRVATVQAQKVATEAPRRCTSKKVVTKPSRNLHQQPFGQQCAGSEAHRLVLRLKLPLPLQFAEQRRFLGLEHLNVARQ